MRAFYIAMTVVLMGMGYLGWWYFKTGRIGASDGLPFSTLLPVSHFSQADPKWANHFLAGNPNETLAQAGCAVASAAMILAYRGLDIDPDRLNTFLIGHPGGYTPEGWIEWYKAAEYDPQFTAQLLPHYEAAPSRFYLDWNLLRGNPVIVRLASRNPLHSNHFMVVVGKKGWDYLVQDPGADGNQGVYPLKNYCNSIQAIRFYKY